MKGLVRKQLFFWMLLRCSSSSSFAEETSSSAGSSGSSIVVQKNQHALLHTRVEIRQERRLEKDVWRLLIEEVPSCDDCLVVEEELQVQWSAPSSSLKEEDEESTTVGAASYSLLLPLLQEDESSLLSQKLTRTLLVSLKRDDALVTRTLAHLPRIMMSSFQYPPQKPFAQVTLQADLTTSQQQVIETNSGRGGGGGSMLWTLFATFLVWSLAAFVWLTLVEPLAELEGEEEDFHSVLLRNDVSSVEMNEDNLSIEPQNAHDSGASTLSEQQSEDGSRNGEDDSSVQEPSQEGQGDNDSTSIDLPPTIQRRVGLRAIGVRRFEDAIVQLDSRPPQEVVLRQSHGGTESLPFEPVARMPPRLGTRRKPTSTGSLANESLSNKDVGASSNSTKDVLVTASSNNNSVVNHSTKAPGTKATAPSTVNDVALSKAVPPFLQEAVRQERAASTVQTRDLTPLDTNTADATDKKANVVTMSLKAVAGRPSPQADDLFEPRRLYIPRKGGAAVEAASTKRKYQELGAERDENSPWSSQRPFHRRQSPDGIDQAQLGPSETNDNGRHVGQVGEDPKSPEEKARNDMFSPKRLRKTTSDAKDWQEGSCHSAKEKRGCVGEEGRPNRNGKEANELEPVPRHSGNVFPLTKKGEPGVPMKDSLKEFVVHGALTNRRSLAIPETKMLLGHLAESSSFDCDGIGRMEEPCEESRIAGRDQDTSLRNDDISYVSTLPPHSDASKDRPDLGRPRRDDYFFEVGVMDDEAETNGAEESLKAPVVQPMQESGEQQDDVVVRERCYLDKETTKVHESKLPSGAGSSSAEVANPGENSAPEHKEVATEIPSLQSPEAATRRVSEDGDDRMENGDLSLSKEAPMHDADSLSFGGGSDDRDDDSVAIVDPSNFDFLVHANPRPKKRKAQVIIPEIVPSTSLQMTVERVNASMWTLPEKIIPRSKPAVETSKPNHTTKRLPRTGWNKAAVAGSRVLEKNPSSTRQRIEGNRQKRRKP